MKVVELIFDENDLVNGVDAISLVDRPAIESDFIALKSQQPDQLKLATVDKEKRVVMGAALIPNRMIYRKSGKDEYYVYFTSETVRKASEMYLMNGKQNRATLMHEVQVPGVSLVESWIVEGDQDKSRMYGLDAPVGSWMVSLKVNNDEIWQDYVKSGKVKGFSIEGYFSEKAEMAKQPTEDELKVQQILDILQKSNK